MAVTAAPALSPAECPHLPLVPPPWAAVAEGVPEGWCFLLPSGHRVGPPSPEEYLCWVGCVHLCHFSCFYRVLLVLCQREAFRQSQVRHIKQGARRDAWLLVRPWPLNTLTVCAHVHMCARTYMCVRTQGRLLLFWIAGGTLYTLFSTLLFSLYHIRIDVSSLGAELQFFLQSRVSQSWQH